MFGKKKNMYINPFFYEKHNIMDEKKIPSTQRCIKWTHNQVLKLLISGREVKENEFKASEQ